MQSDLLVLAKNFAQSLRLLVANTFELGAFNIIADNMEATTSICSNADILGSWNRRDLNDNTACNHNGCGDHIFPHVRANGRTSIVTAVAHDAHD